MSWFASQKLAAYLARPDHNDLMTIGELLAAGKVTPVIDRRYALSDTGPALQYLQEKHARGKVIIDVER